MRIPDLTYEEAQVLNTMSSEKQKQDYLDVFIAREDEVIRWNSLSKDEQQVELNNIETRAKAKQAIIDNAIETERQRRIEIDKQTAEEARQNKAKREAEIAEEDRLAEEANEAERVRWASLTEEQRIRETRFRKEKATYDKLKPITSQTNYYKNRDLIEMGINYLMTQRHMEYSEALKHLNIVAYVAAYGELLKLQTVIRFILPKHKVDVHYDGTRLFIPDYEDTARSVLRLHGYKYDKRSGDIEHIPKRLFCRKYEVKNQAKADELLSALKLNKEEYMDKSDRANIVVWVPDRLMMEDVVREITGYHARKGFERTNADGSISLVRPTIVANTKRI